MPDYDQFLGTWRLLPDTCEYQQGDPPRAGTYVITEQQGLLHFKIAWTDAEGTAHEHEFSGPPNGQAEPFAGGDLADSLSIEVVSPRELNTTAFYQGRARMIAQRQLDETGGAMRLVQQIRFPDDTTLSNISVYSRVVIN